MLPEFPGARSYSIMQYCNHAVAALLILTHYSNEAAPNIPPVRPSALVIVFSVWGVRDQIQPSIMLRALSIRINLMSLSLHTSASVRPL